MTTGGNGWCDGEGAAQCPNPNSLGDGVLDCAYTAAGAVAAGDRACDALAGYDGPTGVGDAQRERDVRQDRTGGRHHRPRQNGHKGDSVTFTAKVIDPFPGGFAVRYVWNWGDGTANTTTIVDHAAHTYKATGTRKITVTVTDNYLGTGYRDARRQGQ